MQKQNDVYRVLVSEITDEDERRVFDVLLNAGSRNVTRVELVLAVYGEAINTDELSDSTKDRKVRKIISQLRERDYPIVSSSDHAGYTMRASEEEMEKYIAEQRSRIDQLQSNINHAYRSKQRTFLVRSYREAAPVPEQTSFLAVMERQEQ